MQTVDIILTGGTVITMNEHFDVIPNGAIVIGDTKIIAIGTADEIAAAYQAPQTLNCQGQYILPGLINTHTHVPMTLMRGLADDLRLDVWLMGYIMPTEREFVSPEFCRLGTRLACAEMIRGGVTTFTDMYYFEDDIAEATAEVGLRAVLGETILKFHAPDAETYEESLAYCRNFIQKWHQHPLITPAVAPHAPYSNTPETLQKCVDLSLEFNVPLMIHIAETKQEADDHVRLHQQSLVHWLNRIGLFRAKVIAAHCVWIDETEMRVMREKGAAIAHNPAANLKLSSGIAQVTKMLEIGVTVGIGTDGPASNNDLDMFEEMRLAAMLAKTQTYDPTALPAKQALLMATRQGAKVLGLDKVTGSLEVGKYADVIVMNCNTLHTMPHYEFNPESVYSQIVYTAKSSDVNHVICHGALLLQDKQLYGLDEIALKQEAQAYADRIGKFVATHQQDVMSKLLAITDKLQRSESFEIQVKAALQDPEALDKLFNHPDVEILRAVHYRQYDTYFMFNDRSKGRVRYREDDKLDEKGEVREVRTRLTYTSYRKERDFNSTVVLSHSRFIAPADRPLRFYTEYFKADKLIKVQKERRRWRIHYQGVLYFVNFDRILDPEIPGTFLEIKTRTWSASDAEVKADRIQEMLKILGVGQGDITTVDYIEMQGMTS
ncbi:MAG: amidohydrolase family protein [Anaerolineae bacterium]|jgi:5-methylthioadenosine/S-adenosylhomocysteine deaminase|nr:amidohydrolase family protein [Anaerolineae bacterium]